MRTAWLLGALVALVLGSTQSAFARVEGPWCLHMSMGRAGVFSQCDMPSYEACRAQMRGLGGTYCTENPYYWWNARQQPPQRKVRHHVRRHR